MFTDFRNFDRVKTNSIKIMKKNSVLTIKELLKIKDPIYVLFHSHHADGLTPYLDDPRIQIEGASSRFSYANETACVLKIKYHPELNETKLGNLKPGKLPRKNPCLTTLYRTDRFRPVESFESIYGVTLPVFKLI